MRTARWMNQMRSGARALTRLGKQIQMDSAEEFVRGMIVKGIKNELAQSEHREPLLRVWLELGGGPG